MLLPVSCAFGPHSARLEDWALPAEPLPRTALRIEKGQGLHWEAHLTRLLKGASLLGWDVSWMPDCFDQARRWVSEADRSACRLRLHSGALQARLEPLPSRILPYRLQVMPHPLGDLRDQAMAAHKGLLGSWDRTILETVRPMGAEDALMIWPDGTVAETAISSCGILQEGTFRMPPLEGRVRSITEGMDLPRWALERGWRLKHGPISMEEIGHGQIWCMNAVRGLWQAERIDD